MNITTAANSTNRTSSDVKRSGWLTYLQLIGCILVMVLTSMGNLLVCFSVVIYKKLQTKTNVILFSLAVSDLLMVISMAFNTLILHRGQWPYSPQLCTVVSSLGLNLCFISILHLCLLSIDRYFSIKNPFQHHQLMNRRRITLFLICLWVTPPLTINLPPYTDFDFRASVYGCLKSSSAMAGHNNPVSSFILVLFFVLIPFAILSYVYIYLFRVVRRHARRITVVNMQPSLETSNQNNRHRGGRILMRKEAKLIKTFALVIGAFLLCYTPFFLLGTFQSSKGPGTVSGHVVSAVTWLAFCNSFVNPIVYSLRYKQFRKSFWKIVCSPQRLIGSRQIVTKPATTHAGNVPPHPGTTHARNVPPHPEGTTHAGNVPPHPGTTHVPGTLIN